MRHAQRRGGRRRRRREFEIFLPAERGEAPESIAPILARVLERLGVNAPPVPINRESKPASHEQLDCLSRWSA